MTHQIPPKAADLSSQLARYGLALGAGGLIGQAAHADGIAFDPVGGLPIVIDNTVSVLDPVEIDLDGDSNADFRFFYSTNYGGGFVATTIDQLGFEGSRILVNNRQCCDEPEQLRRHDLTEYVNVDVGAGAYSPDMQRYTGDFVPAFIDAQGEAARNVDPYTPFRDNPGFIGVSLGRETGYGGFAGAFELVVNSDGSELQILSGSYRQDENDIYLDGGNLISDGFEAAAESDYFSGLSKLARGAQD